MGKTHFSGPMVVGGVEQSHVVVAAGIHTTVGTAASEDITVSGALATDIVSVTLADNGTDSVTLTTAVSAADKITLTFSADPGDDTIAHYSLLRAVS